jgi:hypothetical protein
LPWVCIDPCIIYIVEAAFGGHQSGAPASGATQVRKRVDLAQGQR